jgi:hypothetical protein
MGFINSRTCATIMANVVFGIFATWLVYAFAEAIFSATADVPGTRVLWGWFFALLVVVIWRLVYVLSAKPSPRYALIKETSSIALKMGEVLLAAMLLAAIADDSLRKGDRTAVLELDLIIAMIGTATVVALLYGVLKIEASWKEYKRYGRVGPPY